MVKVDELILNESNPRQIKDDRFKKLIKSIREFPKMLELRPIVIDDDGTILGGNMRFRALLELGYKEIPDSWVRKASELTDEEKQRFIIEDNVPFGEWDWEKLANEWDDKLLEEWGVELPTISNEVEAHEDDYEIPDEIKTDIVLGDLFEFQKDGKTLHRLLCGDSTDSDQVAKLMNGEKADMVFTDPPYEIDIDYTNILLFSENCHVFIFNNDRALIRQLSNSSLTFKNFFVFYHSGTAIPQEGGNEIFLDHVLVSHEINGHPKVRYNKGNGTRSVIKGEYRRSENHKYEKPISFLSPIIEGYSDEYFIILDLFAGGGSMYSAAHQLNRKCYGMELDQKYCQVIIDRMLKLDNGLQILKNGNPL